MIAQFRLFPEQASTAAERVDQLFFFVLAVCVVMSILVAALVITFAIRYRRRSEDEVGVPIEGSLKLETVWSIIPLVIGLVIFIWGADVYFGLYAPPKDALQVYVVGKQWMWKIQHPDGQREINELHVPLGQPVQLVMISEDVIHSFYIPAFRVKQDVLPGRFTTVWFQATKPGRYHLFCAEYCGTDHSRMIGSVVVMEPSEYSNWLDSKAEGAPALEGRKVFLKYRCVSCHAGGGQAHAPLLENLFNKTVLLNDGQRVLADDSYLRESILNPKAKIVAGYQPIMPTFQGQVSEEEIVQLIAFIRALGPGQTPVRVEETPPPIE